MSKTARVTIELGPHDFQCKGCEKVHTKPAYAIAQAAMGVELTFTCECKHQTNL
jgi:hypothetical protein